jgi:amino acid permease
MGKSEKSSLLGDTTPYDSDGDTASIASETYLSIPFAISAHLDSHGHQRSGNFFSSYLQLINTMIGAGTLALPYAFAQSGGLIPGLLIMVVIYALSSYACMLLLWLDKFLDRNNMSFEGVARASFGFAGSYVTDITFLSLCWGALAVYLVIIEQNLIPASHFLEVLVLYLFRTHYHTAVVQWILYFLSPFWISLYLSFGLMLPLCCLKKIDSLRYSSMVSVACILFAVCCMVLRGIEHAVRTPTSELIALALHVEISPTVFVAVALQCLAFTAAINIFHVYAALKVRTQRHITVIVQASNTSALLIYILAGTAGYMTFGMNSLSDILTNYADDDYLMSACRVALSLSLTFTYPLLCFPCRASLENICLGHVHVPTRPESLGVVQVINDDDEDDVDGNDIVAPRTGVWATFQKVRHHFAKYRGDVHERFVVSLLIVLSTKMLALLVPSVGILFGIIGSVGGTAIVFILPALFYLRLHFRKGTPHSHLEASPLKDEDDGEEGTGSMRKCSHQLTMIAAGFILILGIAMSIVSLAVNLWQAVLFMEATHGSTFSHLHTQDISQHLHHL